MVRIRGFHPTGRSSILLEITKHGTDFVPHGFLAQLVEQQPFKLRGLGSNPRKPTIFKTFLVPNKFDNLILEINCFYFPTS